MALLRILQPSEPAYSSQPAKPSSRKHRNIRLIHADGSAHDFTEAISAAEALQSSLHLQPHEHCKAYNMSNPCLNNFFICDSASLRIGKRPCPMHPNTMLEVGHLYYVLPIRTFQHRMSWSHISSLVAMATAASSSSPTAATHMLTYHKSSPSSQRRSVARTFGRLPNAKFYLQLLLCHRLPLRGRRRRVNDMDVATLRAGSSSGLALDTDQPWRGAEVLSSKCSREASRRFNNICDNAEMNAKYVEQLIDRSNSWRPPLFTIQESLVV